MPTAIFAVRTYLKLFTGLKVHGLEGLRVVDAAAFSLCMDNGLTMRVFGMNEPGNVTRALLGEKIGTLVTVDDGDTPAAGNGGTHPAAALDNTKELR